MQRVTKNQTLTPLEVSTPLKPLQSESFLPFLLQVLEVVWATTEKTVWQLPQLVDTSTTKQQKIHETARCRMLNVNECDLSYVLCNV